MVLLHWETLYCLHQHGQGDGQPWKTGRVVQHGSRHGEPQAYGKGWGCREALSYGTAYDGLAADRAIFESAVRTLAEGNTLRATARSVQVDEHAAVGVAGFCPSGASTPEGARTVTAPTAHTRYRFAAHVAPCDSGDGGRHRRSWLGDQCMAVLSRLGSMPGSLARHRVPVPALG
jgi:hypothetical protein